MLTVAILVNGRPLTARSATNTTGRDADGRAIYAVDDGSTIAHDPAEGAVALAVKLLGTIREYRRDAGKETDDEG